MARAIWSGAINFGLVTIPVKLMTAVRDKTLHFNLLHEKDLGRVHNERVCAHCGKKLEWTDVVRGYPVEKDHYVVVSDDDLKKANPEATQSVDIVAFASLEEIDPIYYDTPYYLEPEKRGRHAYALLRAALEKSKRVGIARVVIRTKEHLAALKPQGDALVLELMHWADEVVPVTDLELPAGKADDVRAPEMKAALMLIDGMTQKFDAAAYHDRYREDLLELVEKRAEGEEPPVTHAAKPKATNVVDLADVLQRSLEAHAGGAHARGRHESANDTGPREAKPRKRAPRRPAAKKAHHAPRRKSA
jgi:DNA end-binding protein Ku